MDPQDEQDLKALKEDDPDLAERIVAFRDKHLPTKRLAHVLEYLIWCAFENTDPETNLQWFNR